MRWVFSDNWVCHLVNVEFESFAVHGHAGKHLLVLQPPRVQVLRKGLSLNWMRQPHRTSAFSSSGSSLGCATLIGAQVDGLTDDLVNGLWVRAFSMGSIS